MVLLLEAIYPGFLCGEPSILGDDELEELPARLAQRLELSGSESPRTRLEGSRLAVLRKVSNHQRSLCSELLYLGPRSEILTVNFGLYYLSRVIFGAIVESSSFSNTEKFTHRNVLLWM